MKSLGIDPSTCTGIVLLDEERRVHIAREVSAPPKHTRLDRVVWLAEHVQQILEAHRPDVVCFEAYAFGNVNTLALLVEIGTAMRLEARKTGVPVVEIAPTSLKKFVTGKGNANKAAMVSAVKESFGYETRNHNVADAYGLAVFGLHLAGIALPFPDARTQSLKFFVL